MEIIRLPNEQDWERVNLVRKLVSNYVAGVGSEEILLLEAVALLCAAECSWSDEDAKFVVAILMGNATPENLNDTIVPF